MKTFKYPQLSDYLDPLVKRIDEYDLTETARAELLKQAEVKANAELAAARAVYRDYCSEFHDAFFASY